MSYQTTIPPAEARTERTPRTTTAMLLPGSWASTWSHSPANRNPERYETTNEVKLDAFSDSGLRHANDIWNVVLSYRSTTQWAARFISKPSTNALLMKDMTTLQLGDYRLWFKVHQAHTTHQLWSRNSRLRLIFWRYCAIDNRQIRVGMKSKAQTHGNFGHGHRMNRVRHNEEMRSCMRCRRCNMRWFDKCNDENVSQ